MDRSLVYAGQVPRALDNLKLGEFAMVGLAQLAAAILGSSTIVSQGGFAVSPGGGLNIAVAPGQIYQLQSIEPTIESALNVDGHQVLKQGTTLDAQTLTLAPPGTTGYAQNFLLQVAYNDVPDGLTVLSFQNPTPVLDPSTNTYKYVTYPGPGGNGQASYTILRGGVSVVAKPGTAAPAGSQTTPAPDAGYVGLYVITLAYGATSVSAGNISAYANAPFIPVTLPGVPVGVQVGAWTFGQDTGSADNYAVTLSPNNGAPVANQRAFVKFANANATTSPVFSLNGTAAKALLKRDGTAPAVGDVPAQGWRWVFYDGAAWRFEGTVTSESGTAAAAAAVQGLKTAPYEQFVPGTYTVTVPPGCTGCDSAIWGGGGGGGGVGSTSNGSGSAGGGGGYSFKTITGLTPGQTITLVVGAGGLAGGNGGAGGVGGTTTLGSYHSATGGGSGSANGVGTGGPGGNGSGGDINLSGGYGAAGAASGVSVGGMGGGAPLGGQGGGGAPGIAGNGTTPGGGGGGSGSTTVNPGGAGAPGGCIIRWK